MAYFNKDKKSSGRNGGKKFGARSFNRDRNRNRGFSGGRGGDRPEMHSAKCSECGNNCEVPFRPSGEKPVYCSDCFRRRGGESPRGSQDGDRRYSGGRDSETSVSGKPFYKHDSSERTANYKAQFEQLNSKLDRILNALHPAGFVDIKEAGAAVPKKVIAKSSNKKLAAKKPASKKAIAKKARIKKKK